MLSSLSVGLVRVVGVVIATIPGLVVAVEFSRVEEDSQASLYSQVFDDYQNYYFSNEFNNVMLSLGIAGVIAHSSIDSELSQGNLHENNSNHDVNVLLEGANTLGDYFQFSYAVPIYFGAMWLGSVIVDNKKLSSQEPDGGAGSRDMSSNIAVWGNRSLRTLLLGAPQQLVLAYATGSQRPEEGDSDWDPFSDNNGVSGHAFYGAIPLLTAAQMVDNSYAKYSLYIASTLPGLARVNNSKHYMSQILLGWSLAYFSSETVFSGREESETKVGIYASQESILVGIVLNL